MFHSLTVPCAGPVPRYRGSGDVQRGQILLPEARPVDPPAIGTIRDNYDDNQVLLHSYYTAIEGEGPAKASRANPCSSCHLLCSVSRSRKFSKVFLTRLPQSHESALPGVASYEGFPKIRVPFLGVPIIRTILYWGLYWGPLS